MSFEKNVSIKSGNNLSLSGSNVEVTGSLYGSAMSGTTGQFTSLSASSVRVNNAYTLPTSDGTTGQVISTNGSGELTFTSVSAGSSPGGPDTSVQFNSGSTLSGSSNLTYDYTTGVLSGTLSSFTQVSASNGQLTTVTASNLVAGGVKYPTTDGTDGQILVTDGAGELSFQDIDVTIRVKNLEATQIDKGTPLYVTASGTGGNVAGVYIADAGNVNRMPAACVAGENISASAEGVAFLSGFISGVDTSTFDSGDEVYVAVGGGYTNVRPTGSAKVQPLGYVEKSDANGSGVIQGPGHFWELPNITAGHFWVGASNGVPTTVASSSFAKLANDNIFTGTNTFQDITADTITAREYHTELVSASIIYQSGSTKFGDTPGGAQQDTHEFSGSLYITGSTVTLTGGSFNGNGSNLTSLNASNISAGTLAVARGGTGQTSYTNGQLLIGNTTGNTLSKATLTQGTGISITNGAGSITVAATNNGTVTDVSVVSANGFAGSVATSTTTPAITLSTTVTGILKGNGTSISAATSGTDYAPATSGTSILYGDGSGGFSSVTVGTGLSFAAGTLSNSQIGLTDGDKGDITVASSGATWTIDNDVVSNAKLRNSVATSVIGRSAGTTGDPADIQATADNQVLRRSSGVLGFGTLANASLANSSVTIGSTSVSLGATVTTFTGLASVTSTGFTGSLNGNADTATSATTATNVALTATNTTNASHFVTFVDTAIGNENVRTDTDLTYNPFSNTLTVGTLVETSTREIKENIKTIPNQLSKIKKLNPVKYNKIDSKRKEIGLIAEEVQEVYPEFVHEKGINYPKMVSVLISAVQELTTKVEKQQREITSLKKQIKR